MLMKLKTQKEEDRNRKSKLIKAKLFRDKVFKQAKKVMFYVSFGAEVDTKEMIEEAQNSGKTVAVPVCRKNGAMAPCILGKNAGLKKGFYGTPEPAIKKFMNLRLLDLVIVPGLAFDEKGSRLGRGKGCYDMFLSKIPQKIPVYGLAFDFQVLPSLPTASHDINIRKVISA